MRCLDCGKTSNHLCLRNVHWDKHQLCFKCFKKQEILIE